MKFSKRVYPILEAVEKRIFSSLDIHAAFTDEIKKQLESNGTTNEYYNQVSELLRDLDISTPHICYFSKTINEKANLIRTKLFSIYNEIPEHKGIFCFPILLPSYTNGITKSYKLSILVKPEIIEVSTLEFAELEGRQALKIKRVPEMGISEDGKKLLNSSFHAEGTIMPWVTMIYLAFYHFAEIEIKIISSDNGNVKRTTLNNEKYVNETYPKIEIVDSSWFTKIIRTNGFSVNGHFRLQPYGNNLSQKKLIWIDDFEKQGYSRNAKIE